MIDEAGARAPAPVSAAGTAGRWRYLPAVVCLAMALVMLMSTAFWGGFFALLAGLLFGWARAWWVPAVLAGFYPGHYQLIQDTVGDEGPFVLPNWMAVGLITGLMIVGTGVAAVWCDPRRDRTTYGFVISVLVLGLLSIVTFGPDSFAAEPSPFEYLRVWIVTAFAAAALALIRGFPLRVFLWTSLALAYADLFLVGRYIGTGYGTNLSYVLSLGVFAALLLFCRRTLVGFLTATPLLVGMALVPKQGPLLGTAVGLWVLWISRGADASTRRKRTFGVGIAAVASLVAVLLTGLWGPAWSALRETGMNVRMRLYSEVLDRFAQSPIFGQWQVSPPIPRPAEFYANRLEMPTYPHAAVLEVVLSWGLLGLGLWLLSQYLVIRPAWRVGLIGPWLAGLIFAQSSGDLSGNYVYWFVGAIAVAVAGNQSLGRHGSTTPK